MSSTFAAPSSAELTDCEVVLLDDPSQDYPRMDASSRRLYRDAIEQLAARTRRDSRHVAATAVRLAREQCAVTAPDDAARHVGYYLVAEGRMALRAALATPPARPRPAPRFARRVMAFAAAIAVGSLLLAAAVLPYFHVSGFGPLGAVLITALLVLHAAGRLTTVATMFAMLAPTRRLPRLDFSAGIPPDRLTAVCVPTMLTDRAHVAAMAATLERHWTTIADDNVKLVLLTDWSDARQEEPTAEECALLDELAARIDALNALHGRHGRTPFHLLHRARRYSSTERCWMGWERKRGKLLQFNRLVAEGTHDFLRTAGNLADLQRAVYAIVADDDTLLKPGAIQQLIGTMAHPVARLQRDASGGMRGYGAVVPDIGPRDIGDGRDRLLPDPPEEASAPAPFWPRRIEFDLFGECAFPGQGLYDIRWAHRQLERRFPEGCVLSHDIIEGGFLRCAFSERALFIEQGPRSYRLFNERWHRWMRGDWQNVWVLWRLWRRAAPGERPRAVQWFWVMQNALLSLPRVTLACLLAIVVCGDPRFAGARLAAVIAVDIWPDVVEVMLRLFGIPKRAPRPSPAIIRIGHSAATLLYRLIVRIASALYGALVRVDAILSVAIRILRRRHLLEWVASGHLERGGQRYRRLDAYGYLAPLAAVVGLAWLWIAGRGSASGAVVLLLTAVWPVTVWMVNRLSSRGRRARAGAPP